jgi:pre-rRNA-processing protein TSR4
MKSISPNKILFPEFEIVTEPEPLEFESKERSEKDRMKDFEKMTRNLNEIDLSGQDDKELEKLALAGKEDIIADKQFRVFKKRISRQPDQVHGYGNQISLPSFYCLSHISLIHMFSFLFISISFYIYIP